VTTYASNPHKQYHESYDHLHAGRYQAGFRLFEYRWHPEVQNNIMDGYAVKPNVKPWNGQSLLDKSIVVQAEQGFGDIIQFARFLPALKVLGAKKVTFLAQHSTLKLLGQMECIDVLTNSSDGEDVQGSDYWIPIMSLPYFIDCAYPYAKCLFPVTTKKIIGSEGYLEAIPSNIPPKIGVNWEASKGNLHFIKSIKPEKMLELVGADCYSLNPTTNSYFHPLPNDGWEHDWSKTAQHMKALKGIVTVDTGTAHLAGALGIKTIVLLPKEEFICWRWKNGRWYDSVIALRQEEYDQIPDLIRRM
jgi:hypothetical protein